MLEKKSITKIILLHLFVIFLTILNLSNIKISGFADIMPLLDFTIFKDKFSLWFVFFLGIWADALNGNILGITSLSYIILIRLFMLFNNRIFVRENFVQIWQQFVAFCFLFLCMKWTMFVILNGKPIAISSLLMQLVISSFCYVLMHMLFDYLSTKLLGE